MTPAAKFLAASALGAANTLNARKPFARFGGASVPSFFAGWLTSEMPLQTIGWQAVATAVAGARHGVGSVPMKAALGINAASWAALGAMHAQARKADEVLLPALQEGLGGDYRVPVEPPPAPLTTRQIAVPFTNARKRYGLSVDESYGEFGKRNHLDVWHRDDLPRDGKAPVLLQVHGGAWTIGNKEQQGGPIMAHMAELGWVCVAINYRLSPRATWPDHIVDVKRAIAWIRDNIARYGGDPDYIAITGGSAGGHLSSLAALTPNEKEFQPGFEDVDTTIRAAIPMYGVYDFRNRDGSGREDMKDMLTKAVMKVSEAEAPDTWDQASPVAQISPDAPPFMVIHGENDSLVPVEQARSFVAALRQESSKPVVYAELPGTQHAFDVFWSVRAIHTVRAMGRFLTHTHETAGV